MCAYSYTRTVSGPVVVLERNKLSNLELLRFVAAAMVVIFHTLGGLSLKGYDLGFMSVFSPLGAAGVDIFFVISGFVIYLGIFRDRKSPGVFLKSRFRRIVPAYWIATLAMVAFTFAMSVLSSVMNVDSTLEPVTFPWLIESLFFLSGVFGHQFPVLGQGWSLEFEMFFYLLVAAGLFFRRKSVVFFLPAVVLGVLVSTAMISAIVIEFLLGMLIALTVKKIEKMNVLYAVAALVVSVILFVLSQALAETADGARYLWIPASTLLVFAAVWLPQIRSRFVLTLGAASYAVYLFHGFTYSLVNFGFGALNPSGGSFAIFVCVLVSLLMAEAFGILFERYVDLPIRSALVRRGF